MVAERLEAGEHWLLQAVRRQGGIEQPPLFTAGVAARAAVGVAAAA